MAICQDCDRDMRTAPSCTVSALHLEGQAFPMLAHGLDGAADPRGRCGDCGVQPGGLHHLGCDLAPCPRCRRQLLSCGCPFDEFGGAVDDPDDDGSDGWYDEGDEEDLDDHGHRSCPRCGSRSVIPIFYGRATPAVAALADRRLLELAGEPFGPGRPGHRCCECRHAWNRAG